MNLKFSISPEFKAFLRFCYFSKKYTYTNIVLFTGDDSQIMRGKYFKIIMLILICT